LILTSEVKAEIKRKIIHAGFTGTIAPLIVLSVSDVWLVRVMGFLLYSIFLGLFVLLEFSLKWEKNWNIPFASKAFDVMANDYELKNKTMLGGVFICLSGVIMVPFFNLYALLIGIMVLAYSDSAASIIGKIYPKHSIPYNKRKHWEGTFAFALVSFCIVASVLAIIHLPIAKLFLYSVLIAIVSALVESLPLTYYFDNLTVPLSAALLAQVLLLL
jgi:dolichol kinase